MIENSFFPKISCIILEILRSLMKSRAITATPTRIWNLAQSHEIPSRLPYKSRPLTAKSTLSSPKQTCGNDTTETNPRFNPLCQIFAFVRRAFPTGEIDQVPPPSKTNFPTIGNCWNADVSREYSPHVRREKLEELTDWHSQEARKIYTELYRYGYQANSECCCVNILVCFRVLDHVRVSAAK